MVGILIKEIKIWTWEQLTNVADITHIDNNTLSTAIVPEPLWFPAQAAADISALFVIASASDVSSWYGNTGLPCIALIQGLARLVATAIEWLFFISHDERRIKR